MAIETTVEQWNYVVECAHKAKLDRPEHIYLEACVKGLGGHLKDTAAKDSEAAERAALDKAKEQPED